MVENMCVAMVLSRSGAGAWHVQTGYLVAADLVLTAHHGVGQNVEVFFLDGADSTEATVAWSSSELDVVLLRLHDGARRKVGVTAWATCRGEKVSWVGVAFADAGRVVAQQRSQRDTVGLSGHIEPGGGLVLDRYELVVDGQPAKAEWWKGASGGPVMVANHVVGVVRSVPEAFEGRRLSATPVSRLLDDAKFRELTGEPALKRLVAGEAGIWSAPQQAPPLPKRYLARSAEEEWLRERLADRQGTLQRVALVGLAGSGKSTLAQAVAVSGAAVDRFRDGVLWAWVGLRPSILPILDGWIQALGDRDFRATDAQAAAAHLRTLLADKECLLVVDDAWTDDAELFAAGGDRCAILLTTRKVDLARRLGVELEDTLEVGPMEPQTAVRMLRRGGPPSPSPGTNEIIAAVAEEVGYLPLALELVAGQAQEGRPWESVLEDLRVQVGIVRATDDPDADEGGLASRPNRSLTASLLLSLAGGPRARIERFAWLGLLAEDASFGGATAATLWGIEDRTAERELTLLRRASLLKSRGADRSGPLYGVHDVVRDIALEILTRPADDPRLSRVGGGLGIPLPEANGRLLDQFRAGLPSYAAISDDGYIHDHLIEHLLAANRADEVDQLLGEANERGESAWFAARVSTGAFAGFVSDVSTVLAHRLAERARISADAPIGARLLRHLLVLTSQAPRLPTALMARLAREGRWTLERAQQFLDARADPIQRAASYVGLAQLPGGDRLRFGERAMADLRAIKPTKFRAWEADDLTPLKQVLTRLAQLGMAEQLVHLAEKLPSAALRLTFWISAIPSLRLDQRDPLIEEAIDLAVQMDALHRFEYWEQLAPHLSADQVRRAMDLERATASASPDEHEYWAGTRLSPLIVRLAQHGEVDAALDLARGLEDNIRTWVLSQVAAYVPESRRTELITEVQVLLRCVDDRAWVRAIEHGSFRWLTPAVMTRLERVEQLSETVVRSLAKAVDQTDVATWLAEVVDSGRLGAAASAVELLGPMVDPIQREQMTNRVWLSCSSGPPQDVVGPMKALLRAEMDPRRCEAIVGTLLGLDEETFSADFQSIASCVLAAAPEASVAILDRIEAGALETRIGRLSAIADVLPSEALDRALHIANVNGDEGERLLACAALAVELKDEERIARVLRELQIARQIRPLGRIHAEALARLARVLPDRFLARAMRVFEELTGVAAIAVAAAPALFQRSKDARILDRALHSIKTAEDSDSAAAALELVYPMLTRKQQKATRRWLLELGAEPDGPRRAAQMIQAILLLESDEELASAFISAVQELPAAEQLDALESSLYKLPPRARERANRVFDRVASRSDRAFALCMEMLATGGGSSLDDVGQLCDLIGDLVEKPEGGDARWTYEDILPYALRFLPDVEWSLGVSLNLKNSGHRAQALEGLAPRLQSDQDIARAIEALRGVEEPGLRADALRALAGRLDNAPPGAIAVLREAFSASLDHRVLPWQDRVTVDSVHSLLAAGPSAVREGCHDLVTTLVHYSRAHVLGKIFCAAPLLAAGFSTASLRDAFDALEDVGRFWP